VAQFHFKIGVIRKCAKRDFDPRRPKKAQKLCLYARTGPRRLLGRHPDAASARRQELAIQIRKRGG
jgi:hypothetical protein